MKSVSGLPPSRGLEPARTREQPVIRLGSKIAAVIAVTVLSAAAFGQPESADTPAFVTVVSGGEAVRLRGAQASIIDTTPSSYGDDKQAGETAKTPREWFLEKRGLRLGEGVRTTGDGTVVVMFPDVSAVAYLEGATELRVLEPTAPDSGINLSLILIAGRVSIVQKSDAARWFLVATGPTKDRAIAYTLSKGCSQFIEAGPSGASFAARRGGALYFSGPIPAGALIDASGKPINAAGLALPQGQRISLQVPDKPVADEAPNLIVPGRFADDAYNLALVDSDQWLKQAEQGDFTPVRIEEKAALEVLAMEWEPRQTYQPRPVTSAPSPHAAPSAIRTTMNPAQSLVQSGIPGSVIAGQRFLQSRIIGNPGTGGSGALTVNRSASLSIRFR